MTFEKAWRVLKTKEFVRRPIPSRRLGRMDSTSDDNRCVATMFLDPPQHFTDADRNPLIAHKVRCKNQRDEDSEYCWAHKARDVPTDALGNEMRI